MNLLSYILFFLIGVIFSFLELSSNKRYNLIIPFHLFIFLCLLTFRGVDTTADTYAYFDDFLSVRTDSIYTYSSLDTDYQFELGFSILSQVIKFFVNNNVEIYFALIAVIQIVLVYLGISQFLNKYFEENEKGQFKITFTLVVLYIYIYGYMYNGIVLRAGLAISLIFFGTSLIYNRKILKGVLFCLVALFFHRTAMIGLLVWIPLFNNLYINKSKLLLILFFFLVLYLLKFNIIFSNYISNLLGVRVELLGGVAGQKFSNYLGRVESSYNSYSLLILVKFLVTFYLVFRANFKIKFEKKLTLIMVISNCLMSITSAIPAVSRVFDYFILFYLLNLYIRFVDNKIIFFERVAILVLVLSSGAISFYRLAII